MTRHRWKERARLARCGCLGTLACSLERETYQFFLREVYDLRHPHVGNDKHAAGRRTWDRLAFQEQPRIRLWRQQQANGKPRTGTWFGAPASCFGF